MKICISIGADEAVALGPRELRAKAAEADLIELRLDSMPSFPQDTLRVLGKPVLVTCRPRRAGGVYEGEERARLDLLRRAARYAEWVDLEWGSNAHPSDFRPAKVLLSHPLTEGFPSNTAGLLHEMSSSGCDAIKLVGQAQTTQEAIDFVRAAQMWLGERDLAQPPVIAFAKGEVAAWTRVAVGRLGAPWVYAALDGARPTGAGQPPLSRWLRDWRARRVGRGTALYGLVCADASEDLVSAVYNDAFERAGIDAVHVPVPLTEASSLARLLELDFRGWSVGALCKESAGEKAALRTEAAEGSGCVNALVRRAEGWEARNTDVLAALRHAARALCKEPQGRFLDGKRVLVLGTGAEARALAWAFAGAGARVAVTGHGNGRAREVARRTGAEVVAWEQRNLHRPDVLVNASPIGGGSLSAETPFPLAALRPPMVVLETVCVPRRTRLVREAGAAGCVAFEGTELMLEAAALRFEAWTGKEMPPNSKRAVRDLPP